MLIPGGQAREPSKVRESCWRSAGTGQADPFCLTWEPPWDPAAGDLARPAHRGAPPAQRERECCAPRLLRFKNLASDPQHGVRSGGLVSHQHQVCREHPGVRLR